MVFTEVFTILEFEPCTGECLQLFFTPGQVHTAPQPLLGHGDHSLSPVIVSPRCHQLLESAGAVHADLML